MAAELAIAWLVDQIDKPFSGRRRFDNSLFFVVGEREFKRSGNSAGPELGDGTGEGAVDAIFALVQYRAWDQAAVVQQDRLGHGDRGRRWGVVGATGLQKLADFRAAAHGAGNNRFDLLGGGQIRERDATDAGLGHDRDHRRISMATDDVSVDILRRHVQCISHEVAIAGAV